MLKPPLWDNSKIPHIYLNKNGIISIANLTFKRKSHGTYYKLVPFTKKLNEINSNMLEIKGRGLKSTHLLFSQAKFKNTDKHYKLL